jgi:hypothetical protein
MIFALLRKQVREPALKNILPVVVPRTNCSGMVNKHFLLEFFSFQVGSHYVAHVSLKLKILPPQPPECWDYRHAPSCLASLFFFFFFFWCSDVGLNPEP